MSQPQPNDTQASMEEAALALYYRAAEMIKSGLSSEEVEKRLIESGVRADTAHTIMERLGKARTNVTRQSGRRNLLVGAVLMGLALMTLVFSSGDTISMMLAIATGVIGIFWLIRGVQQIKVN